MFGNLKKKIDEDYFKTEVTKIDDNDVSIAMDSQDKVDDKINNSGLLQKYSELAKLMYGMLKDYRRGVYNKVPWFTIATVAFSFLYILNPLDIIPDFIPGLGYIDDMAIFTLGLRFIESDLHNYLDWKIEKHKKKEGI